MKIIDYDGKIESVMELLKHRFEIDEKYETAVKEIISNVRKNGDTAVAEYSRKYDSPNFEAGNMEVTEIEIKEAWESVDVQVIDSIKKAKANIEFFHKKQLRESWTYYGESGEQLGMKITPVETVGIYVPGGLGGSTPLVSTVLMTAVPAKVAGVKNIVMITPPNKENKINPYLIAAAQTAGVDRILKVGSAWGIAGLAYGTNTIPKVDKIVGPGNIYVTVAKKQVYGNVDIDMIAGPSEILIIADGLSNPEFTAADLLSQAEHDTLAASILVTTSKEYAEKVSAEVQKQLEKLPRAEIARESINKNGLIICVDTLDDAFDISNSIAPEHLELQLNEPFKYINNIKNAGAIFLGDYTPEPIGDYFAGPNHVLPTNMTAKFYSPLNVDNYLKKTSIIYYPEELFRKNADDVIRLAEIEGLEAHANSVRIRIR